MPAPKAKTPTNKKSSKPRSRVASISSTKKSKFSFKPWHAAVVVALVAVTGYAVVRFGSAATTTNSYEFNASQLSGGTLVQSGSEAYRQLNLGTDYAVMSVPSLSSATFNNTSQVCARVRFLTDTSAHVKQWVFPRGGGAGGPIFSQYPSYKANTTQDLCVSLSNHSSSSPDLVAGISFVGYYKESSSGDIEMKPTGKVAVIKLWGVAKPVTPPNCKTNGTCPPPPPPPPPATAYCSINVTKSGSSWVATWASLNLGTAKYGWDATLSNSATGNTTNNVGVNGSRVVVPRVGYNNTYTITIYDGWTATNTKCSATVRP